MQGKLNHIGLPVLEVLALLGALNPAWGVEPICGETFAELAEPEVQRLVFEPEVHTCGECLANSGEMGRELLARFREQGIPVRASDFEIAVIFNRRIRKYEAEDEFRIKDGIFHSDHHDATPEEPIPFKYHAVLVYKGMVVDMDLKSEVVLPWDQYVSLAFPPRVADELEDSRGVRRDVPVNQSHMLRVTRIPLRQYLKRYPRERPSDTYDMEGDFIFRRKSEPIDTVDFEG